MGRRRGRDARPIHWCGPGWRRPVHPLSVPPTYTWVGVLPVPAARCRGCAAPTGRMRTDTRFAPPAGSIPGAQMGIWSIWGMWDRCGRNGGDPVRCSGAEAWARDRGRGGQVIQMPRLFMSGGAGHVGGASCVCLTDAVLRAAGQMVATIHSAMRPDSRRRQDGERWPGDRSDDPDHNRMQSIRTRSDLLARPRGSRRSLTSPY